MIILRYTMEDYSAAASLLRQKLGDFIPEIALILGSGLGDMAALAENPVVIPYGDIPGFGRATAPGHKGQLVFGTLEGKAVAIMQGRLHFYEGYSMEEIVFPIRVLRLLGCKTMISTNAAGGINLSYQVGDICLITDHIKLIFDTPLRGENLSEFGIRFPDMTLAYTPRLKALAKQVAERQAIPLHEGVYMLFPGPSYETPAEIRAARSLGADLAGMSTVPEVLAARHAGMEILGFSLVTNAAAGITGEALTEEEVLEAAQRAKSRFSALIQGCIREL